jgi:hypothetical protein
MMHVASGKGIYLGLGSLLTMRDTPGLAMVRVDEPRASLPVCAVWRAGESSPVVLQFVDSVREAFRREAGLPASGLVGAIRPARRHDHARRMR